MKENSGGRVGLEGLAEARRQRLKQWKGLRGSGSSLGGQGCTCREKGGSKYGRGRVEGGRPATGLLEAELGQRSHRDRGL